jgi:SNF2 family DNA or RNA helicase
MALSEIVKQECPVCKKVAVEKERVNFGNKKLIKLVCGHMISFKSLVSADESVYESIVFSDGKRPRPYQIEGMKFVEEAGFNCIIADEQGLGKTIEIGCLLKLHPEELLPCVITCPTTVKRQWLTELMRICCPNGTQEERKKYLTQVIQSGKEKAIPGFQIYIVTFDMLKKEDLFEYVPDIKLIVVDECQRIKNHLSDRAKAVQKIAKKCEYHIPMSGTIILNNSGEAFTILNLVKPTRFPQYQRYLETYCDIYESAWGYKVGGLKDRERFHEDTRDILIRRTKDQVLKDLPAKDRKFYHVDLDPRFNKAYGKALEELDELFYDDDMSAFEKGSSTIAIMSKLRHITGLSKVEECIDFTTEFLLSTQRKITIFSHHKDVADLLVMKLNEYLEPIGLEKVIHLSAELDGNGRANAVEKFKTNDKCRVMVASTLAAGEGINLQFCSDAIMLERQWNPGKEVQAEDRFHRFGQLNPVSITYIIAIGTIDEYFTELVEQKRAIVSATIDNVDIEWQEQNLMKELTTMLLTKGRERWRL